MTANTRAATRADEPDGAPRIAALDVLRGIAILGILFMNINDMGNSLWAMFDGDPRLIGWTSADRIAWTLREILANGTARCLLELLFGAGMVILTERIADGSSGWGPMRRYYWRNFVLFLFGVVHLFVLLWPGDILHTYGLAAMIAFLFRRQRPRWLLTIGLVLAASQLAGGGYGYVEATLRRAEIASLEQKQKSGVALTGAERKTLNKGLERRAERARDKARTAGHVIDENKARTGGFASWAGSAWDTILSIQGKALEALFVWEAAATMLIGAALFKLGILQGLRPRSFYVRMTLAAYAVGLIARGIGAYDEIVRPGQPSLIWPLYEIARLATTLGHVGAVHLLLGTLLGARLLRPFAAAGRTALSIYIAQTLICLWVLYPPFMLGLYGQQGWAALMLTALAVDAVLLVLANIWVRHFAIAPVEWAWRSIVEGRRLPFRRQPPVALAKSAIA